MKTTSVNPVPIYHEHVQAIAAKQQEMRGQTVRANQRTSNSARPDFNFGGFFKSLIPGLSRAGQYKRGPITFRGGTITPDPLRGPSDPIRGLIPPVTGGVISIRF